MPALGGSLWSGRLEGPPSQILSKALKSSSLKTPRQCSSCSMKLCNSRYLNAPLLTPSSHSFSRSCHVRSAFSIRNRARKAISMTRWACLNSCACPCLEIGFPFVLRYELRRCSWHVRHEEARKLLSRKGKSVISLQHLRFEQRKRLKGKEGLCRHGA